MSAVYGRRSRTPLRRRDEGSLEPDCGRNLGMDSLDSTTPEPPRGGPGFFHRCAGRRSLPLTSLPPRRRRGKLTRTLAYRPFLRIRPPRVGFSAARRPFFATAFGRSEE